MHFTLSWDVEGNEESFKRISSLMTETISKHALLVTEPISKYVVVKVESEAYWHIILKALTGICEMYKGKINFIMSPPMKGGQYNGKMRDWIKVNEATKDV
jgi:hypothetical protein